jgi:hypothetical protein
MKNYNLTIYQASKKFNIDSFFEDFSEVSDTEPLVTTVGDSTIMIFGSDVELLDLSTFLSSILGHLCYGFTLVELGDTYAAFFPMDNFNDLGLNDIPDNFKKSKKPFLGILKGDNLNKIYSQIREGESETDLDLILEKISKKGITSLTTIERGLLDKYSKQHTNEK